MNIKQAVRKAAIDNDIDGVMAMCDHTGLTFARMYKVWNGDTSAKVADVITVLSSLGLRLTIGKGEQ